MTVGRPVWEGRRLLDELASGSPLDAFVRDRAGESLAHVFTLLSLVLPREPLQLAFRGLQTDDEHLRGTALEYLDSVLPAPIRQRLWPFLEPRPARHRPRRPREEAIAALLRSNQSIVLNLEELQTATRRVTPTIGHSLGADMARMLAPQCRTRRVPDTDSTSRPAAACPTSLLSEQVRRLAICAAVGAGLWTYGLVMDALVRPLTSARRTA